MQRIIPVRPEFIQSRDQQPIGCDHDFWIARFHRENEIVIIQVARDPRELERALDHSQRRVAVPIQDAVRKRAVICPDAHGNPAFLAKIDKWRKALANPIQLRGVLLIGVFADDEFLGVGVVARVNPHLLDPFRSFDRRFRFEMDVGDNRHIAAALAQTLRDILKVARVFHCGCGDSNDLTACIRELDRLLDRRLGVHRVTRDHRLHTDRVVTADADVTHLHLARLAAVINKWIFAVIHCLRLRVREPFAISFNATIIFTSICFVLPLRAWT